MPDALRPLLLAIVLLDLAFVQITDTVDVGWLTGLWAATLAAPLLERWRELLWYRVIWNSAVLVAFAFLMQHALTTGLLHMLEDGLLLAALCQVHLLNNVGRRQRPDLLFFNSFLIAFVTSFFSHDLGWSVCFVLYAAVLVPSLQLYAGLPTDTDAQPGAVRALLRDSVPRSVTAIALTALAFVLWPRDFRHAGWLDDTLRLANAELVAFAEEVRLDRSTTPTLSDAPVLRIKPADGMPDSVPAHWRGITFVQFDGAGWRAYDVAAFASRFVTDPTWQAVSRSEWQRSRDLREPSLDLRLLDPSGGRLFLPAQAGYVALRAGGAPIVLDPKADGAIALGSDLPAGELRATVRLGAFGPQQRARTNSNSLAPLRQLPSDLPRPLQSLATDLQRELPPTASDREIAEALRSWLERSRHYALPGTPGAARNLSDFLLGTGGGHCEYFATTLALLLRLQGIPCRLVGGYLAHEWDAQSGEMVVRQKDAHAWVEALLADGTWLTVDATPPSALERAPATESWWDAFTRAIADAWRTVTSFDEHGRSRLFAWLWGQFTTLLAQPWLVAAIALGAWAIWRRRHRGTPPAVRELQIAMRRARVRQLPGETPRDVLARSRQLPMSDRRRERLDAAVAAHEQARYREPAGTR